MKIYLFESAKIKRSPRRSVLHRHILILALFAFLFIPAISHADHFGLIEDGWEERIKLSLLKIANLDYENGLRIIDEYITDHPNNPGGYFFYAASIQEKVQKYNDPKDIKRFLTYANICVNLCLRRLDKNPEDIKASLFLGGIYGYMGLVKVRRRQMVRAFMDGVRARKRLEYVISKRPDIPDAYFGLGMLYYFSSRKAIEEGGAQGWLVRKLITHGKDLRKKGIEMTERAIHDGSLAKEYARSSLMWMRFYEKEYDRAKTLAVEISSRYPRDNTSTWLLGRVALIKGNCSDAKLWFGRTMEINKDIGIDKSRFQDVEMAIKMADACGEIERRRWDQADALADKIEAWLDDDPKIVIEYQDENYLISYWKEEIDRVKAKIKKGRLSFRSR